MEILELFDELCGPGNPEFRIATVLEILNPEEDLQRRWTIGPAFTGGPSFVCTAVTEVGLRR